MKNNISRACVALAASMLAFCCCSVGAAEMATTTRASTDFQSVANSDLLILGPVSAVDLSKARFEVLGQWIPFSETEALETQQAVGRVVAVYGTVANDGSLQIASVREQSSVEFVPGATPVYLKGKISSVDAVHGTARIGALSVNYTNALHTLVADDLSVGAIASFAGQQFAESNKLYADSGLVHNAVITAVPLGQTGSGSPMVRGQTGSGFAALGQTGSGRSAMKGQTGSGSPMVRGQTGSG